MFDATETLNPTEKMEFEYLVRDYDANMHAAMDQARGIMDDENRPAAVGAWIEERIAYVAAINEVRIISLLRIASLIFCIHKACCVV